jgi:hypothetical protein
VSQDCSPGGICRRGVEGTPCVQAADCASSACGNDSKCSAAGLSIRDQCEVTAGDLQVDYWIVNAGAQGYDAVDLGVVYYLEPESAGFTLDTASASDLRDAYSGGHVIKLWTTTSASLEIGTEASHSFLVHNVDGTAVDTSNDPSTAACGTPNSKAVICLRVADEWYPIWGTAPVSDPAPCARF